MADPVGALRVDLSANAAQFKRDLGKASKAGSNFGDSLKKMAKGTAVAMAAIAAAAAAVGAALGKVVKDSAAAADQFAKMSSKTGESVEFLSALAHAAELSGVSVEQMEQGIGRLARTMSDAQNGLSTAKRGFDQLKIAVANSDGTLRPTREVMLEVADRFANMSDATKKAALAQELFGRAGLEMLPLLNQGSAAIREQMAEAELLGITFSTKSAVAAEQFNDNLSRLGKFMVGIRNTIAEGLLPILSDLVERMLAWVKANADAIRTRILEWAQRLGVVIANVVDFVVDMGNIFRDLAPVLLPIGRLFFRLGQVAWNALAVTASGAITILLEGIKKMLQAADFVAKKFGSEGFADTIEQLEGAIAKFRARTEKNWDDLMVSMGLSAAKIPELAVKPSQSAGDKIKKMTGDVGGFQIQMGKAVEEQQDAQVQAFLKREEARLKKVVEGLAFEKEQREKVTSSMKELKQIETDASTAALSDIAQKVAAIEQEGAARRKEIADRVKEAKEAAGILAENEGDLANRISLINAQAAAARSAQRAQERKEIEELFKDIGDQGRSMEQTLTLETLEGSAQRTQAITFELQNRIREIEAMKLSAERTEELITLATQAATEKRRQLAAETTSFWKTQLEQLVQSNVFSLSSITQMFVTEVDKWRQNLDDFAAFWENLQSVLFQAALNFIIQWIAQMLLASLFGKTKAAEDLATTEATEATKTSIVEAQENARRVAMETTNQAFLASLSAGIAGMQTVATATIQILGAMLQGIVSFMQAVAKAVSSAPIVGPPLAAAILASATAAQISGQAAIQAALGQVIVATTQAQVALQTQQATALARSVAGTASSGSSSGGGGGGIFGGLSNLLGPIFSSFGGLFGGGGSGGGGGFLGNLFGGFDFGFFQHGGLIRRPTIGVLGEAGPELVVPLSSSLLKGLSGSEIHVHVNVDGREAAQAIVPHMPDVIRRRLGINRL